MIYLLIPVYNEELNIQNLSKEINSYSFNEDIFIVFSDDGSTDNTIKEIENHFFYFNYKILGNGINYGPGNAFNVGFEWILNHSKNPKDVIVTLESDCTSDLSILPEMLMLNEYGYSLVLASVYAQNGGFDSTNFFRKMISFTANLMFRTLFEVKVQTISSFYRVYSVELLRKINYKYFQIISQKGFICMLEVLLKSINEEAKIIEVPMRLQSHKRKGKSKMKIFKTMIEYFLFLLKIKSVLNEKKSSNHISKR